ncbi:MAG: hypothetical protein JWN08_2555 [Frankiales bacterium]|nr:hypothetical protein [Frankiales bacterium]
MQRPTRRSAPARQPSLRKLRTPPQRLEAQPQQFGGLERDQHHAGEHGQGACSGAGMPLPRPGEQLPTADLGAQQHPQQTVIRKRAAVQRGRVCSDQ